MTLSNEVLIIKAEIYHLREIIEIEKASFSDPWSFSYFINLINDTNSYFSVSMHSDHVTGYCILQSILDEGEIYNIAVGKEFRRKGIGIALLNDAIIYGRSLRLSKIHLEVRSSNCGAIMMYKKMGFFASGKRTSYYRAPKEDAIIMTYEYKERQ